MTYTADTVPSHVPHIHAARWAQVFNTVFESVFEDGDKSQEECEARAYRAANAILSDRSNTLKEGDYVIYRNDKGVQQRGCVLGYTDAEKSDDGVDGELLEIERWKPVRDGWEPSGQIVKLSLGDCHKTDTLWQPSRASHKGEEFMEDTQIKSLVDSVLQAAVPNNGVTAVKRLGEHKIGGYCMTFGSEDERDIEGDWFSKNTDIWADVYSNQPILFDHASGVELPPDPDLTDEEQDLPKRYKIGRVTKMFTDDVGHFIEAVLDARNKWTRGIMELVDKGVLNFSSGSAPHLIRRADNGEVKSWAMVEISVTPSPAEPRNTEVRHVRNADGTALPEVGRDGGKQPVTSSGSRTIKTQKNKATSTRRYNIMNNAKRRLVSLLNAYWDGELAAQASAYKAAHRATKQEGEAPEENPVVQEAASQLEQLLEPIAEQAKSALGLDPDEVKAMLFKAALSRVTKQDVPEELEEEDDYLEEGNPDEVPMNEYLDALDEETLEELPLEEEEDVAPAATMSARRSADVAAAVRRELARLPEPRGRFSTKSGPTIMSRNPANRQFSVGRMIKAVCNRDYQTLRAYKQQHAGYYKAMGLNPDSSGGFLVAPEYAQEVIELLRAKSLFLRLNNVEGSGVGESLVTVMPMSSDTLYLPTQTGASTAYWVGENSTITASDLAVGQKQLVARKLAARVIVSNEWLDDVDADGDAFIRDDIAQQLSLGVDDAILYGDGIGASPLGVYHTPNVDATALNAAPTYANLLELIETVELEDVPKDNTWRWILNPRDKRVIRSIQDTAGQYIFANDALSAGTQLFPQLLLGYEWLSSTRVHRTGSPEETDIFFGRWKDVVIGMRKSIEIVASDVAGDAFENDQTHIRAIMRLDIAMRHAESVAILTDVRAS